MLDKRDDSVARLSEKKFSKTRTKVPQRHDKKSKANPVSHYRFRTLEIIDIRGEQGPLQRKNASNYTVCRQYWNKVAV